MWCHVAGCARVFPLTLSLERPWKIMHYFEDFRVQYILTEGPALYLNTLLIWSITTPHNTVCKMCMIFWFGIYIKIKMSINGTQYPCIDMNLYLVPILCIIWIIQVLVRLYAHTLRIYYIHCINIAFSSLSLNSAAGVKMSAYNYTNWTVED